MKLKTRLMVAFCIIIILPIASGRSGNSRIYTGYRQRRSRKIMVWRHRIPRGYLSNSLQLMSRYTKTEYDEICKQAKADPEKLESVRII